MMEFEEEKELNPHKQVLDQINQQTRDTRDDDVFVLELDNIPFKTFTPEIRDRIARFSSLQVFSLISCELESLENFPPIPALVRLDLVNNNLEGEDLQHLKYSRHIQTLMLSHNNIKFTDCFKYLSHIKELTQVDFAGNDIENLKDYRKQAFQSIPSLQLLDNENKKGDFDEISMQQSAMKVPTNLFQQATSSTQKAVMRRMSSQQVVANNNDNNNKPQKIEKPKSKKSTVKQPKKENNEQIRKQQQADQIKKEQENQKKKREERAQKIAAPKKQQKKPAVSKGKMSGKGKIGYNKKVSSSEKAGITFPVGRIGRYLKENNKQYRISSISKVYMGAVLEYLCAEVAELAGNCAKQNKKKRILPSHIRIIMNSDTELNQFAQNTIFSDAGGSETKLKMPLIRPE